MFIIYFENRMVITYLLIGMAEAGLLAYHWFRPGMTDKEYCMMVKSCILNVFFWPVLTTFSVFSLIEWIYCKITFRIRAWRARRKEKQDA